MIRLGLRPRTLNSAFHIIKRTQVSRAAKKVTNDKDLKPVNHQAAPIVPPPAPVAPAAPVTPVNPVDMRTSRAMRLFPKFMRSYASRIASAPLSHVTAFLVVHEISAIVPLFGVWAAFYYLDYVPMGIPDFIVESGAQFIRRLAERQDWTYVLHAEKGSRIILQGAAAWAIVKAILPIRIAFSLWAMPWFAKWFVVPISSRFVRLSKRVFKRH